LFALWVQAGFAPGEFWWQTPRHFHLALKAVRKRRDAEREAVLASAWETGAFAGLAQSGKLKPLRHYLKPSREQSAREMAGAIQEMGRKSNMRVKRVKLDRSNSGS
jgi:hypothetical protein